MHTTKRGRLYCRARVYAMFFFPSSPKCECETVNFGSFNCVQYAFYLFDLLLASFAQQTNHNPLESSRREEIVFSVCEVCIYNGAQSTKETKFIHHRVDRSTLGHMRLESVGP